MDRIYSRAPGGDEYPVEFAPTGPEDRGQFGRMRIRKQGNGTNGAPPQLRDTWWHRCPWCREMIEIPHERLYVDAGRIRIDGTIICGHCEIVYLIDDGVARRLLDVEGAGHSAVTSEALAASREDNKKC
jgi:uncharacterized protein YbaR (Trm112 family)